MKHTSTPTRRQLGPGRLGIGVTAFAAGLTLLFTPLGASGQTTEDTPAADTTAAEATAAVTAAAAESITITQTPSGNLAECVSYTEALVTKSLTAWPVSDEATFRLHINASKPLCEPIEATAVVYKMPDASRWPQTLHETKSFTISEAGETVITFAKACDRVQYDVTTGSNPQVLNTGIDHTLLFPGRTDTAFQHVGNGPGCETTTTTTSTTTTSVAPTSIVNTTTTTAAVRAETTVAAPSTTGVIPAVLGATSVPTGANSGLAVTGSTSGPFALVGGGLVFIGLAFMLASHRRHA